jgi:hypothetical protein
MSTALWMVKILKHQKRDSLHPKLQAEIEFGVENSIIDREQAIQKIEDNIKRFINQNKTWKNADILFTL